MSALELITLVFVCHDHCVMSSVAFVLGVQAVPSAAGFSDE